MKTRHTVGICCVMLLSGCGRPLDSPVSTRIGEQCEVQFRRDALGAAAELPIPSETNNYNGAEVSLTATLNRATHDWIIVANHQAEYMIPVHAILLLKFNPAASKK